MEKSDYIKTQTNHPIAFLYCEYCGVGFLASEDDYNWELHEIDTSVFRPYHAGCWDFISQEQPKSNFPAGCVG